MTGSQETEAFGRTIGTTGSPASPFGYHGAEGYRSDGDGPAGLEPYQKVGARYYDATFGRFITRDTELSQAPYAYCDGDPVNCSDPSGHKVGDPPPLGQSPDQGYGEPGGSDGSGGTTYPGGTDPGGSGPGNTPNPSGGSGTIPTGSGTVTVSSASGGTVGYSENNQKISITGLGLSTQTVGTTNIVNLGSGFNLTGINTINLGTGASSHSGGIGYSSGGFSFSFTLNSSGTSSETLGYKGAF